MVAVEFLAVVGLVLLAAFFLAFRRAEGTWLPPAAVFVVGLFSTTYVYATLIWWDAERWPGFVYANFEWALWLATASFAALLGGYCLYAFRTAPKPASAPPLARLVSPQTAVLLGVGVVLVGAFNLFYAWATGAVLRIPGGVVDTGEGVLTVDASTPSDAEATWLYRAGFIGSHAIVPLILFLFLASRGLEGRPRSLALWVVWIGTAIVLVGGLLTLRREQAIVLLVALAGVYHFRVAPIRPVHVAGLAGAYVVLQLVHSLRVLGQPGSELSVETIGQYLGGMQVAASIGSMVAPLQGWDVFTTVLSIVPAHEPFRYGGTYLDSALGLFQPRALGLGSYDAMTPASWYQGAYGVVHPHTLTGADFSLLAEAYVNFGLAMPVAFFGLGFLVAWLSRLVRESPSGAAVFAATIVLLTLTISLRMDSTSLFKGVAYSIVPLILMAKLMDSAFARWQSTAPVEGT